MLTARAIKGLTELQRTMLLDHVDRTVAINMRDGQQQTRQSLLTLGLLGPPPFRRANRPRWTTLTEEGRRVVCVVLGAYADALTASQYRIVGHLDRIRTLNALKRLRAMRAAQNPGQEPLIFIPPSPSFRFTFL